VCLSYFESRGLHRFQGLAYFDKITLIKQLDDLFGRRKGIWSRMGGGVKFKGSYYIGEEKKEEKKELKEFINRCKIHKAK